MPPFWSLTFSGWAFSAILDDWPGSTYLIFGFDSGNALCGGLHHKEWTDFGLETGPQKVAFSIVDAIENRRIHGFGRLVFTKYGEVL